MDALGGFARSAVKLFSATLPGKGLSSKDQNNLANVGSWPFCYVCRRTQFAYIKMDRRRWKYAIKTYWAFQTALTNWCVHQRLSDAYAQNSTRNKWNTSVSLGEQAFVQKLHAWPKLHSSIGLQIRISPRWNLFMRLWAPTKATSQPTWLFFKLL